MTGLSVALGPKEYSTGVVQHHPGVYFWEIFGTVTTGRSYHVDIFGVPKGIRTPVTAVKELQNGRHRMPLDDSILLK